MKADTSRAIRLAGSINKLAAMMNVSRQLVQYWSKHGAMPEDRSVELQRLQPKWFDAKGELIKPRKTKGAKP